MKYTTAKALAREFFSSAPRALVFEGPDELELNVSFATDGEVELRLAVELLYERKRNHTSLRCSPHLYASRLLTYPNDSSVLQSMPSAMRRTVLALRSRLSGRVSYSFASRLHVSPELSAPQRIDDWTDDDFLARLLLVSTAAVELATHALPAATAEELLAWAREQDANTKFPMLVELSSGWSVRPKSSPPSPITSAA